MTDIIFSFDTEDFTCSRAADGILEAAEMLREEGIRGCFNIVGLLAEQLLAWGRTDVLEALKYHEVDFHSFGHTLHPCLNEYTNIEDFSAAYSEVMRQETAGAAAVKAATGAERLWAACPPGNNENIVAMYAYSDMGIPVYAGELMDTPGGQSAFFCNMLYVYYYDCFEHIVEAGLARDAAFYDRLAARKTAVIYNHPNRWLYNTFWDAVNYYDGVNHHPFGEWEEAERMTDAEREHFRGEVRTLIRALKADGRFRFSTYEEQAKARCAGARVLRPEGMPGIAQQLKRRFFPLEQPTSLCIADVFQAAVSFLRGNKLFAAGRAFGFLETPYAISESVTVRAEDVRAAAQNVDLRTFLPEGFDVGGVRLGPADFLFAMLEALNGSDEIRLSPRPQNIDLSDFLHVADPHLDKWMFAPEFKAEILTKRTPLQGWTIRY